MSLNNRVVWSEGLFLQSQHFQQQDRYVERLVEGRAGAIAPNGWGFTELELERGLLSIGKVALRRAVGVFPDGTPFRMPDDDPLPLALEVAPTVRDQTLFLALPVRGAAEVEADRDGGPDRLSRYEVREQDAPNSVDGGGEPARLEIGALRTRLLLASDIKDPNPYACLPLARVVECRVDKQVVLDDAEFGAAQEEKLRFIPTVLRVKASSQLTAFVQEFLGLLHQRGEALAGRATETQRSGTTEFAQFLMLQAINRYEPIVAHIAALGEAHPEALFQLCAMAAGELSTFTSKSRRPPRLAPYQHHRLQESFAPVILAIREVFRNVIPQRAIPIPVETKKYGTSVAAIADRTLYSTSQFVLAARADVPAEELRRRFPAQLKVSSVEKISELVRLGLPGVPVQALPVAPPEIRYHAGFAYFELDQTTDLWEEMKSSGGLGIHVAGEFPGLVMECWAIRNLG